MEAGQDETDVALRDVQAHLKRLFARLVFGHRRLDLGRGHDALHLLCDCSRLVHARERRGDPYSDARRVGGRAAVRRRGGGRTVLSTALSATFGSFGAFRTFPLQYPADPFRAPDRGEFLVICQCRHRRYAIGYDDQGVLAGGERGETHPIGVTIAHRVVLILGTVRTVARARRLVRLGRRIEPDPVLFGLEARLLATHDGVSGNHLSALTTHNVGNAERLLAIAPRLLGHLPVRPQQRVAWPVNARAREHPAILRDDESGAKKNTLF